MSRRTRRQRAPRRAVRSPASSARRRSAATASPDSWRPWRTTARCRSSSASQNTWPLSVEASMAVSRIDRASSMRPARLEQLRPHAFVDGHPLGSGDLAPARKPGFEFREAGCRVAAHAVRPGFERAPPWPARSARLPRARRSCLRRRSRRHGRCGSVSARFRIPAHAAGCSGGRCARPTPWRRPMLSERSGIVAHEPERESPVAQAADLGVVAAIAAAAEPRAVLVVEPEPVFDAAKAVRMLPGVCGWSPRRNAATAAAPPDRPILRGPEEDVGPRRAASRSRER